MYYPQALRPTASATFVLSSNEKIEVPKATPYFEQWLGEPLENTYGGKAVLNFNGEPLFAELGILRIFENEGWNGVWVDTYGRRFRTNWSGSEQFDLPEEKQALFDQICNAGKSNSGCWDVFCWKNDDIIFAEAKRLKNDRIQASQINWLEAALKCGLKPESFLVVEWAVA